MYEAINIESALDQAVTEFKVNSITFDRCQQDDQPLNEKVLEVVCESIAAYGIKVVMIEDDTTEPFDFEAVYHTCIVEDTVRFYTNNQQAINLLMACGQGHVTSF